MTASRAALTRDSLRVKIVVQRVHVAGTEYRVIQPAGSLRNAALYQDRANHYMLYVDRADGRRMGALWLLAARSPRSLVYLPTRSAPPAPGIGWLDEHPLDLVLAPRTVQLRPSRWTRIRERLRAGNAPRELRTARVPEGDLPDLDADRDYPDDPKHEARYLPRRDVHAETLLLTGHTEGFREGAKEIFAVTRDGPPRAATRLYIPGSCNYHECRPVYDWDTPGQRAWEQLHVEFCPRWAR